MISESIAATDVRIGPYQEPDQSPPRAPTTPQQLPHSYGFLSRLLSRLGLFRRKFWAPIESFQHSSGYCYTCPVPVHLKCDKDGESNLIIFEDSLPLNRPHAIHSEIDTLGQGRYSHWQGWLLFSTSDNSDPSTNGRLYTVREV